MWLFFSIEVQSWNMYNVCVFFFVFFLNSTFLKISVVWLDGISRFTHLFCPLIWRDRDRAGLVIWHIVHFPSRLPHFSADGAVHQLNKNGRKLICSFSLLTLDCPVKSLSVISPYIHCALRQLAEKVNCGWSRENLELESAIVSDQSSPGLKQRCSGLSCLMKLCHVALCMPSRNITCG